MFLLKNPLFYLATAAIAVSASPITERTASAADIIIYDIGSIDVSVKTLIVALETYNDILSAAPVAVDITGIDVAIRKGSYDASLAPSFNADDSTRIADYTSSSISVDVPVAVELLKSKKPYFSEADITSIVLAGLKELKSDHDAFSAALVPKLAAEVIPGANAAVAAIGDSLQSGIDYFSS